MQSDMARDMHTGPDHFIAEVMPASNIESDQRRHSYDTFERVRNEGKRIRDVYNNHTPQADSQVGHTYVQASVQPSYVQEASLEAKLIFLSQPTLGVHAEDKVLDHRAPRTILDIEEHVRRTDGDSRDSNGLNDINNTRQHKMWEESKEHSASSHRRPGTIVATFDSSESISEYESVSESSSSKLLRNGAGSRQKLRDKLKHENAVKNWRALVRNAQVQRGVNGGMVRVVCTHATKCSCLCASVFMFFSRMYA